MGYLYLPPAYARNLDYRYMFTRGAKNSWINQEHFQQYLRQRATVVDPDELDRADKLDAVEAGNEEDSDEDHIGVLQPSAVVSPYAGVGPMTMPTPTNLVRQKRHGVRTKYLSCGMLPLGVLDTAAS